MSEREKRFDEIAESVISRRGKALQALADCLEITIEVVDRNVREQWHRSYEGWGKMGKEIFGEFNKEAHTVKADEVDRVPDGTVVIDRDYIDDDKSVIGERARTWERLDDIMPPTHGRITGLIPEPMTLEGAVETLNTYRHNFETVNAEEFETIEWIIDPYNNDEPKHAYLVRYITEYKDREGARGEREYQDLTAFEAIAIAEKYEREAK